MGKILPSSIKGGTFTPDSDTAANTVSFTHGLGAVPKMFIVWTNTTALETFESQAHEEIIYAFMMNKYNESSGIDEEDGYSFSRTRLPAGSCGINSTAIAYSDLSTWLTSTVAKLNCNAYYKSGVNYKWLAIC